QQFLYEWSRRLPARSSLYARSSFQRSDAPPLWWHERLNIKLAEHEVAAPDPNWPYRWMYWERKWRQYSELTLDIDGFIQQVTARPDSKAEEEEDDAA